MEDFLSTAARFINTTSNHIFLTGKAGTGKTTFLKNLGNLTYKRHIVVAPTGIAALNAGGVTIHSQFLLPPSNFIPDRVLPSHLSESGQYVNQDALARKHALTSARRQVLRSIDLLVIDEVSMLRADLLDAIDYRMKSVRGNFRQSFGGVQVLFIGDLFQLPPVVRNETWEVLNQYYKSPWFYEARALQGNPPVYIELDKIFRQHDPVFINLLNNLRNNAAGKEDIDALNVHYKTAEEIRNLSEAITLTTHNYKADEINQIELRNLASPSRFFEASIDKDFPESMYPVVPRLELKVGAQIMFVRNDSENKMYYNGKLATVVEINGEDVWVEMAESHVRYQLKRETWENKKYALDSGTQELQEELIGSFKQYPVKLAWAITVHKSQGLTFDKAIIDVGQAFADGQVYVALSRLRSLDGLVLRTRINPAVISTDRGVIAFAENNHRPEQLEEVMKSGQQEFIRQLIDRTFDFDVLQKDIQYIQKDQKEEDPDALQEESMKPVLTQILKTLESERANTAKFRWQLAELLRAQDISSLLERIRKGSAYYKELLSKNLKVLLLHLETVRRGKRVKTYVSRLEEIDQAMDKKRVEVDKVATIIEGILSGEEKFEFEGITRQHAQERTEWLDHIRKELPPLAEKKRKSKGPRKSKKNGEPNTFDLTVKEEWRTEHL